VACARCGRRGRYRTARLVARHGAGMGLPCWRSSCPAIAPAGPLRACTTDAGPTLSAHGAGWTGPSKATGGRDAGEESPRPDRQRSLQPMGIVCGLGLLGLPRRLCLSGVARPVAATLLSGIDCFDRGRSPRRAPRLRRRGRHRTMDRRAVVGADAARLASEGTASRLDLRGHAGGLDRACAVTRGRAGRAPSFASSSPRASRIKVALLRDPGWRRGPAAAPISDAGGVRDGRRWRAWSRRRGRAPRRPPVRAPEPWPRAGPG
jgi:hypothetical protein